MTKRIAEFDLWRPGYGNAVVSVFVAGTSTLANIYTNEGLSVAAPNPQTLEAMLAPDGTRYGKFDVPLYTGQAYYLSIDGIENTGIIRPGIASLSGEDASEATVIAEGASYALSLEKFTAATVNVVSYGVFVEGSGGVAATNTATLELAIAALTDGGEVIIPAGLYKVNAIDIPQNVVLRGQGRDATILQSVLGEVSFTLVGNRAGFRDISLDGNNLLTDSVGIKSDGNDEIVFDRVKVKRFETGIHFLGGSGHVWNDFSIENTETAAKLHGDGDPFQDLLWKGGVVDTATTVGVQFSYEDALCNNANLVGVGFKNCVEDALEINGAQNIKLIGCFFDGNTKTVNILDDTATLTPATEKNNDVIGVQFIGGRMEGGIFKATGTAQDVILKDMKLKNIEFNMTTPLLNFVVLENCFEDTGVTITGETAKLLRLVNSSNGSSFGLTTNNTATKAWSLSLEPGQIVYLEAKVIGKGRNVAQRAAYHVGCGAYRPGSTLAYDTQTANFNVGQILTGASSGATARIQADSDSGATGTLTLTDIKGEFLDNEIITDSGGSPGSATVNGSLTGQNASLDSVGNINLRAVYETNSNWVAVFAANGSEIEFLVTGDTSQTVEWTVNIEVVTT